MSLRCVPARLILLSGSKALYYHKENSVVADDACQGTLYLDCTAIMGYIVAPTLL